MLVLSSVLIIFHVGVSFLNGNHQSVNHSAVAKNVEMQFLKLQRLHRSPLGRIQLASAADSATM